MQWFSAFQTWWQRSTTQAAQTSVSDQWPRSALALGLVATTLVGGLKVLGETNLPGRGWLQGMELEAYDSLLRLKADQGYDPRIVVVGITEDDLARYQVPLSDEILAQVLSTLQSYQPRVIGLDLYRNTEQPPGTEALAEQWQATNLVGILELGTGEKNYVPPPPALPTDQLGFNDLLLDRDGVVRRFLFFATKQNQTYFSLAMQVAQRYLQDQDPSFKIANTPENPDRVFWGDSTLTPLNQRSGAYQGEDDRGYQLLLDYRTPYDVAPVLSVSAVLANASTLRDQVHNKIVLIGNIAPSSKDLFFTPYTGAQRPQTQSDGQPAPLTSTRNAYSDIYGVNLHAHITSYLLDLAQGKRQPFRFWPEWAEWAWLSLWGFVGAGLSARLQHPLHWLGAVGSTSVGLVGLHYGFLLQNLWVPGVAPLLSLGTGAIGAVLYGNHQIQREKQYLAQQAKSQEASIALLQQLVATLPPDEASSSLDPYSADLSSAEISPASPDARGPVRAARGPAWYGGGEAQPPSPHTPHPDPTVHPAIATPFDPNAPQPSKADLTPTLIQEDDIPFSLASDDRSPQSAPWSLVDRSRANSSANPGTNSGANAATDVQTSLPTLPFEFVTPADSPPEDAPLLTPSADLPSNAPTAAFPHASSPDQQPRPPIPSPRDYIAHIPTANSDLATSQVQSGTGSDRSGVPNSPRQTASDPNLRFPVVSASSATGGLLGGRYKVRSVLGEGGFGVTYIAQDQQRPGQPDCVIKRLYPARQDSRFLQVARRLFQSEAEIMELLGKHDRIPRLLAYFEENCEFYLVQDLVPGVSLSQELQPGQRWSIEKTLEFLKGLLPVLDFIHERQVIHRDLKPSNIMRRDDGKLVLIDFGAVKYLNGANQNTAEAKTIAVGTQGYAAPEQMAGYPQLNSDLYALGMLAIQGLTGIPPHLLEVDRSTGHLNWRIHVNPSLPLFPILERLTQFNFIDRYASAAQVLQDLNRL